MNDLPHEFYLMPSYVDKSSGVYGIELLAMQRDSQEIELLEIMSSNDTECKGAPDWFWKTTYFFTILKERYNHFNKNEVILFYGYDMFMSNLIKRMNDILLKLSNKSMKQKYSEIGAEQFTDYLIDTLRMIDKRNESTPIVRAYLIQLIPIIINSPKKEIIWRIIPRSGKMSKEGNYNELEMIMFNVQHQLLKRILSISDEITGKSKEQVDHAIKTLWAMKKNDKVLGIKRKHKLNINDILHKN
jgi:hypothetical protein